MTIPDKEQSYEALQKSIVKIKKLQMELNLLKEQQLEPIAIIGMGCRFPGGANHPQAYWDLLKSGGNGIREIPQERWDVDAYFDPNPEVPGKMYVRQSGFLNVPIDQFDAHFFGIPPLEAKAMDPQQRLLLEVTWEALEDAAINPKELKGSATGVFVGISTHDYSDLMSQYQDKNEINPYGATGVAGSVAAGRLSYFLGLQGPSWSVDTACSSSIVALHSACQSLRMGESDLVLAAGVNLMLIPDPFIAFCKLKMLAEDGFCKTFDAEANGYVRGEGCGVVVLKRLSDSLRDGDRIVAVIKGSGVNQDGASSSLTAPRGESQEALLKEIWSKFHIDPGQISYLEAHGTGTPLGDPIEVHSVQAAMKGCRQPDNPLWVGSVKTNIGHLESAAGIAGLIKIVLSLQNEALPPHLHFKKLNPYINLESIPAKIPLQLTTWKRSENPRLAAISSFGFSGTNAHAVIEEAPILSPKPASVIERPLHILTLSARSEKALKELAQSYLDFIGDRSVLTINDIVYTANCGRAPFEYRLSVLARNRIELLDKLKRGDYSLAKAAANITKIAFIFTHQLVPYSQEVKNLYATQTVFKDAFDACEQFLAKEPDKQPHERWLPNQDSGSTRGPYTFTFIFQYALAELWKSWGIKPHYVLGDGVGEYVAAVLAGIITLGDGLKLVEAAEAIIQSGQSASVSHLTNEFHGRAQKIPYQAPELNYISGTTGEIIGSAGLQGGYWMDHLSKLQNREHADQPVSMNTGLTSAIQELQKQDCDTFLVIGLDHKMVENQLRSLNPNSLCIAGLSSDDLWKTLLQGLSKIYLRGFEIDWKSFEKPYIHQKISLPTYPFQRQPHWANVVRPTLFKEASPSNLNPFLTTKINSPFFEGTLFETTIDESRPDFIQDHQIYRLPIVAGAVYLSTALAAAQNIFNPDFFLIENIEILNPLILQENRPRLIQTYIHPELEGRWRFEISSQPKEEPHLNDWTSHIKALVRNTSKDKKNDFIPAKLVSLEAIQQQSSQRYTGADLYQFAHDCLEYDLGRHFKWIEYFYKGNGELLGKLRLPDANEEAGFVLYPGLIDSCFHLLIGRLIDNEKKSFPMSVPFSIEKIIYDGGNGYPTWIHATYTNQNQENTTHANITLLNKEGQVVGEVIDFVTRIAPKDKLLHFLEPKIPLSNWFYELKWEVSPIGYNNLLKGKWLIFPDTCGLVNLLLNQLKEQDCQFVQVLHGTHFAKITDDHYQLNFQDKSAIKALLQEFAFSGILFLSCLGQASETNLENIERAQEGGAKTLLYLYQALIEAKLPANPVLWLVTNGVQSVNEEAVLIEHTPLMGIRKSALIEHPEILSRHIDLPALALQDLPSLKENADLILKELQWSDLDDQIAYRRGLRYVPRLKRIMDLNLKHSDFKIDPVGSYLITGGLGGMGLKCAEWLVRLGATHVVLVGRRAPSAYAQEVIDRLLKEGSRIEIGAIDVADPIAVDQLMQKFGEAWPSLKGIIHSAGVLQDGVFQDQDWSKYEKVFAPKIAGGWNLHKASLSHSLDFFILFSSVVSVFGSPGQGNYAAANNFLDGLAFLRHRQNLPVLSISWGPWAEVGMSANLTHLHQGRGFIHISPEEGIAALELALQQRDKTHFVLAPMNWNKLLQYQRKDFPMIAGLMPIQKTKKKVIPSLLIRLQEVPANERKALLLAWLRALINQILGLPESESFKDRQDFFSGGIDSVTSMELKNRLQDEMGNVLIVPTTLIFDHPTLELLTGYFEKHLFPLIEDFNSKK